MAFTRILVAIDGGEQSIWATDAAAALAEKLGASLAFVHVISRPLAYPTELGFVDVGNIADLQARAQGLLRLARDRVGPIPSDQILREGIPAQEIAAAALHWNADLIVIGSHNRGRLARIVLGSTAEAVLHKAHCPVLVISHPFGDRAKVDDAAAQVALH
jgi:nucleotide-binding universal stress UspA family protein